MIKQNAERNFPYTPATGIIAEILREAPPQPARQNADSRFPAATKR
jgi:hypothetical protein